MARRDPHSFARTEQGRIVHLDWRADVDFERRVLSCRARLRLADVAGGAFFLDTRGLAIQEVADGQGRAVRWRLAAPEGFMGARLELELEAGTPEVTVAYETTRESVALQWLEPALTLGGRHPYLFSQCQPIYARTLLPCQDSPSVRFDFEASVTVADPLVVVMAAAPGERSPAGRGRTTYRFSMPQAIPSYLFALAAGDLVCEDLGPRSRVYAEPGTIAAAAYEFAAVDDMLQAAEQLFGPYRWDRFDFLVMPPSFPYGGMENPRLTFLTPTLLCGDRSLVNVLAHELAHSWTGNLVTNATMNDFWLNEGFTVWAERRILERLEGARAAALAAAIGRNGLEEAVAEFGPESEMTCLETDLAGIDPDEVYSLVPYEKGFLFVSALERAVGRERFDAFIGEYLERFAFTSIDTASFEAFLAEALPEAVAGMDVERWIHGVGIPDDAPSFPSEDLERVERIADEWRAGRRPREEDLKGLGAKPWLLLLQALPRKMPEEECRWLDERFDLTRSPSSEILCGWLVIAGGSAYTQVFERIDEFVGRFGRMKFLKPIYTALAGNPETRAFARDLLARHGHKYHSIARAGLERILD